MTTAIFKKLGIALALGATTLGAVAPAQAHDRGRYDYRDYRDYRGYERYGDYRRHGYDRDVIVRYDNDRRGYRDDRYYRCGRSDGTTGTILGAIAGGLIGSSAAGRHGDHTTGAILGGAVGAVAGRAIDKSGNDCR